MLRIATTSSSLAGLAAREAINWLLWPAIAVAEGYPPELPGLVRSIGTGTEIVTSILCLFPTSSARVNRRIDIKVGKTPVQVLPLDLALFERLVLSGA